MSVNFKSILALGLYHLPNLPTVNEDGTLKSAPSAVLEGRQIPRHNQEVVQRSIQWQNLSPGDSKWEDADLSYSLHFLEPPTKHGAPRHEAP